MHHLRFKGNHYNIGVKRGQIFKKCNIYFTLNMDNFQMNHGIESEKILNKYFKEVFEETKGITDTIEVDYYNLTIDQFLGIIPILSIQKKEQEVIKILKIDILS